VGVAVEVAVKACEEAAVELCEEVDVELREGVNVEPSEEVGVEPSEEVDIEVEAELGTESGRHNLADCVDWVTKYAFATSRALSGDCVMCYRDCKATNRACLPSSKTNPGFSLTRIRILFTR